MQISAIKIAESTEVNRYYNMKFTDATEIYQDSPDRFSMIYNAFKFGYAQGMKAEKAAQKRRASHE